MVTTKTTLIGLLGYPLNFTFSPRMHNETFKRLGLDFFYFPIEVDNEHLADVMNGIRYMNF
ncbi:MAG: quinate/shikimate dehydrogenase, partial [Bacillota bacterium]|nr:quinate/shikimate dehydrogenase [Bacillota bacterium]